MKDEINFSEMLFNRDERLLDYITNLQEENERLKNDIEDISVSHFSLFKQYEDYKSRIDKTIRYIEKCRDYHKTNHSEEKIFPDEITSLLMILNGDDE